jgi:hypothetical protein
MSGPQICGEIPLHGRLVATAPITLTATIDGAESHNATLGCVRYPRIIANGRCSGS